MDTATVPFETLLHSSTSPGGEYSRDVTWKAIVDRLVEVDGAQLLAVVRHLKKALSECMQLPTSTHSLMYQAVKKLGCRGEVERKLLIKEDVPKVMLQTLREHLDDALALSFGLQALYPLAFDAPHRTYMLVCGSLPIALSAMAAHPKHFALQQHGCKFLQLMAFDDDCKTEVVERGGLPVVLDALLAFSPDKDLVVSASDLVYFLVADLEPESSHIHGLPPRIVAACVQVMELHSADDRIQSHGVAILNSLATHPRAKMLLCTKNVLSAVEHAVGSTFDATTDALILLYEISQDPACRSRMCAALNRDDGGRPTLHTKLSAAEVDKDDGETIGRLEFVLDVLLCNTELSPEGSTAASQSVEEFRGEVQIAILCPDRVPAEMQEQSLSTLTERRLQDVTLDELATTSVSATSASHRAAAVAPSPGPIFVTAGNRAEMPSALISPSTKSEAESCIRAPTLAAIADSDDDTHGCAPKDELNSNCFRLPVATATDQIGVPGTSIAPEAPAKVIYSRPPPAPSTSRPTASLFATAKTDVPVAVVSTIGESTGMPAKVAFAAVDVVPPVTPAVANPPRDLESSKSTQLMEQLELQYQEAATEAIEKERTKTRKLLFNYKLLQRRLAEQHKLLCVHNERSVADSEIHEALLQRVTHLETALAEATRTCEAERSARLAHETEAMKAHGALAAALQSLEDQKNRVFKEKKVSEKQFVEVQHLAEALTAEKDALLESLRAAHDSQHALQAQIETLRATLGHAKAERLENLLMREEDVELPQPSTYYVQASPMPRRPSQYSLHGLAKTFLIRTYKCLEACSEGHGVHFSILRRYFVDCGLVVPPLVLGDVDMILNRILAVAQDNKLKTRQRKDYEFSACSLRPNFGKLRHRYFSRSLFCEAVTLVGAKKYADVSTPEMLRLVILNHLNPFSKSIEAKGDVQLLVSVYDAFGFMKVILDTLHIQYKAEKHHDSRPESMTNDQIVAAMLEMVPVLQREQKPLRIICDYYTTTHDVCKDEALDMGLESLVSFAVDFEIIPAFLDRLAVKRLYKDILTFVKTFLARYTGFPCPIDKKKYVAFYVLLARLAVEIFKDKRDYEMPESQVTGLLQWLDNSRGRGRIIRKGSVHAGIKFSNKLYAIKIS
ncbi:hypothetical protein ACHHYP_10560 [Achlya hypogyna]|uniref:Uncharacterized protein n=1 Tax=Achlya hypogyna TaxID=1202772 RepID=A0A1V9YL19_ACHHY|nr:hypothetical protein ACHHYP_10560 [Achlya hypogyna]